MLSLNTNDTKGAGLLLSLIQKKRQKITFTTIIQMTTLFSGLIGILTEFSKESEE